MQAQVVFRYRAVILLPGPGGLHGLLVFASIFAFILLLFSYKTRRGQLKWTTHESVSTPRLRIHQLAAASEQLACSANRRQGQVRGR